MYYMTVSTLCHLPYTPVDEDFDDEEGVEIVDSRQHNKEQQQQQRGTGGQRGQRNYDDEGGLGFSLPPAEDDEEFGLDDSD